MRIRPEAIVISSNGNLSYAEILEKVKAGPDLKDLGGNVSRIRRTQKVKNSLGENVTVRTQKYEVYIQCKDLDEVTSKGEISTALMEQFKLEELAEESIVTLRKAQTVTLRLPVGAAQKLLAGRVAQDLLEQTIYESEVEIFIISELSKPSRWRMDYRFDWWSGDMGMWSASYTMSWGAGIQRLCMAENKRGILHSCYAPPNRTLSELEEMLDSLVLDARGRSPGVIAGDLNT
ncbi:unnamed protein product [Hermetia illucens]|uniref:Endonuclease/exonuclease/phosphatase domain-containing protein n=1 Tax=Hermetia illucens TaxID=343691 RepID=A0A7R8UJJ1_HERIL|nr:unnamed protein product [Hermetia illucens]